MRALLVAFATIVASTPVSSADIGLVKVANGSVRIERDGGSIAATVGSTLQPADVVVTGSDSSAGVTFADNSLVSLGPDSVFRIDRYAFDTTTNVGQFEGSLRKGRLAAVSGKMVRQSPGSMKIHTPSAVMGVRGTEFVVHVGEAPAPKR